MTAQARLNGTLVEWDSAAAAFEQAVREAAQAKVAWERYAAIKRIDLKRAAAEQGEKLTVQDLNAQILADDGGGLYEAAEVSDALVTGLRKRLDLFAAQADACRSEIASERRRQEAWEASPAVPTARDVPGGFR